MLITIDEHGKIQALYHDNMQWSTLGDMSVTRASDVVFDNQLQRWYVMDPQTREPMIEEGFLSRIEAIRAEISLLEQEMLDILT
jgi:hypothetical protein